MIILIELISGFALLLYGIKLFNLCLTKLYTVNARNSLKNFLRFKIVAVFLGITLTLFLENSSVITVLAVALVQARFLSVEEVVGLIIGANIGTSIAAFISWTAPPLFFYYLSPQVYSFGFFQ